MKTKITFICAIVFSTAAVEAGFGIPNPSLVFPEAGESPTAPNRDPIILASDVEFQRKVQTQTTLIQHEASERRRKKHHKHNSEYLERKKESQKSAQ